MRQLYPIAALGIVFICLLVVPAWSQSGLLAGAKSVAPVSSTQKRMDSLHRLTQPGYYSALLKARQQPNALGKARVAADVCSSYLCTTTSPALSISLTNNGPLTCTRPIVALTVTGAPASSTYAFGTGVSQPSGPTSSTASVTTAGLFSVTVTAPTGATATASTSVSSLTTGYSANYQPLADLYNSTDGANWTRKDNWLTGCSPCNWYGVTCDGNGRVTALSLISNNLNGTLPTSLSALTSLQTLELGANALTGGIPPGITALTALQTLNLSRTQLGGTLPTNIGNLRVLQYLYLNESQLVGSLPASLGNLTSLQNLQLYTNQLTGCFPNSLSALCGGSRTINFSGNPGLPGGGDFAAFCSTGTGSCEPVNTAPVATTNLSQTATVGRTFSYTVAAFTDAETPDSLTYSASISPANGLSFDPASRVISGRPNEPGPVSVTVTATDAGGLSASTSFSISVGPRIVGNTPLRVTLTASPTTLLTSGSTVLRATASGGNPGAPPSGYTYNFSGPGDFATSRVDEVTVTNLPAGVQTFTVVVSDASTPARQTNSATVSVTVTEANTAPTVANAIPPQSATVGQAFSYVIPANTFTDAQTSNSLSLTVSGLPQGLSFTSPATISGTPSVSGVSSVTVTATDPGNLSVSTTFTITVSPASMTVTPTGPFAITGVTTISCVPMGNQINLSFTPQYSGATGDPISFSVANELAPTTAPGPYSLRLYTDNPTITLKATQSGTAGEASFRYNWLAACNGSQPGNTAPTVANAIPPQSATVGQAFSYVIPANTFTDAQTPNSLSLTVSGLPQGLGFTAPATISGTPSVTGTTTVTVTATDPGSLSASTSFVLSVSPASSVTTTAPFAITGVTTLSCTPVGNQINLSFTPRYAGLNGQPISFSVANELAPTTAPGPYSLRLYTDNPIITLKATQSGTAGEASFAYNWLAACQSGARLGSESGVALEVVVLSNPVTGQEVSVAVRGAESQPVQFHLSDVHGRTIHERTIERAGTVERQTLSLGSQPAGMLLLRVSTPTQSQTVKVIKID